MPALYQQHRDMVLAHKEDRLGFSSVICFSEKLIQEYFDGQRLFLLEAIRTAETYETDDRRYVDIVFPLYFVAIAEDRCQMRTGGWAGNNDPRSINTSVSQINERSVIACAYIIDLNRVFVSGRQPVPARNHSIALRSYSLTDVIKDFWVARIPATAMHPVDNLVT